MRLFFIMALRYSGEKKNKRIQSIQKGLKEGGIGNNLQERELLECLHHFNIFENLHKKSRNEFQSQFL